MLSFFGSTPTQLSLSYVHDLVQFQQFAKQKTVLCEYLSNDDVDDYYKLCSFLHLQRDEFYATYLNLNSNLEACIAFIRRYKSKGYKSFMCIVEYDVFNQKQLAFGNHYIIACVENDKAKSQTRKLTDKQTIFCLKSYPCVMLKNYVAEKHDKLELIFPSIQRPDFCDPIILGKMVKKSSQSIHDFEFNKQLNNLLAASTAKWLLHNVRLRLNLPSEYETTPNANPSEAVNYAFTIISDILPALQTATEPLKIKEMMENLNDNLIKFVSNYYDYLRNLRNGKPKIYNHENIFKIIHQLHNCVKDQSYRCVNDVFCVVYDNNPVTCETPIFVTNSNFNKLLNIFKPKGFTTLKFYKGAHEGDDDNWYAVIKNKKRLVSFTRFNVSKSPSNNETNSVLFKTSCVNGHAGEYYWVCSECQSLVKVNQQAKICCACGVVTEPVTVNPECFQCVLKKGIYEVPLANAGNPVETGVLIEAEFAFDRTVDADVSFTLQVRNATAEPVSASFSVCNVTVTHLLTKKEDSFHAETVQKLSQFGKTNLFVPRPRTYTVLVIGSSGAGKSTLLNSIYSMQQHKTLEEAVESKIQCLLPVTLEETGEAFDGIHENNVNEHYAGVGQSVTQHPRDYVLDYGTFKIRFVDTPGITDTRGFEQDADNIKYIQEHLLELKEVHAVMFVIKNSEVKLSAEFENTMLALFGILPRTAIRNCFFVYTFAAPDFQPGAARTPLTALLAKFSKQHNVELSLDISNEYCVDNGILRQLLHCQKSGDKFAVTAYAEYWKANENSILRMFDDVRKVNPVLREDFKLAAKMKKLGDALRPYGKGVLTSDAKRLMASVANGSLHGIAIYCRNKSEGEAPVEDGEWKDVQETWKDVNEAIANTAGEIDAVIKELKTKRRDNAAAAADSAFGSNKVIDDNDNQFQLEMRSQRVFCAPMTATSAIGESDVTSDRGIPSYQEVDSQMELSDSAIACTDYGIFLDPEDFNARGSIVDEFEHVSEDAIHTDDFEHVDNANAPETQLLSFEPTLQFPAPPSQITPLLTILVIGKSANDNMTLINNIYLGKQKELEQEAENGASVAEPGKTMESGCVIYYGSYEVHFISLVYDTSPIDWNAYPEVHGFIFVIQDDSKYYLSHKTETDLRNLLGMVPRSAVNNCCIVNNITVKLSKEDSLNLLSAYLTNFCKSHLLADNIRHFCDDSRSISNDNYIELLNTVKANIEEFIFTVAESPVSNHQLKLTECMAHLGNALYKKITCTADEKRLIASVMDKTMSNIARLLRVYGNNVGVVMSDEDWKAAATTWNLDKKVLPFVCEINNLINPSVNPGQQTENTSTRL